MTDLKKKKLFLFDIDGTLAIGNELFDGSLKLLEHIESIGGDYIFITNNSTKSQLDYVQKFKSWNINTRLNQFITSGYITKLYLKENFSNDKIFVVGTASFISDLTDNGLNIVTKAEADVKCVVVSFDNELNYSKLENACELLSLNDIPFLATNPDLCCPAPFGFIPDCGSICQMIENSVHKSPSYLGKPNRNIVDLCLKNSTFSADETIVVGDRLYTDIACGINAEVDTCLVLTGEAKKADLKDTEYMPSYVFENINDFYNALI